MTNIDLALRLELPDIVGPGATVPVRLVLTNMGRTWARLVAPQSAAALNIIVFDRLWDLVSPESSEKVHIASLDIAIPPGASQPFEWDGLSYTSGTARLVYRLGPGVYHVLAVYHPGDNRLPARSDYPAVIASNAVALMVS
jgi:hypothetical protein